MRGPGCHSCLQHIPQQLEKKCKAAESRARQEQGLGQRRPLAHPLQVYLWLEDPGTEEETAGRRSQEDLGTSADLHPGGRG